MSIQSIQPVIEAMEELIVLHDSLMELSEQKTRALVDNHVEELNRIVHKEAQLIRHVTESESKRMEAVDRFLISKGFRPSPQITINEVIKLIFYVEDKHRMQDLQVELSNRIGKLQQLNEHNKQLIEQSLSFIDYSIDLLAGQFEDDAWYENPLEQKSGRAKAVRFDTRA